MVRAVKICLPMPPSTNSLYANVPGRGRVPTGAYQRWRKAAQDTLWGQKIEGFMGPVTVMIRLEDKGRRDLDNCAKALCDFIVATGIITDDNRTVMRRLTLEWHDIKGCEVEVTSV